MNVQYFDNLILEVNSATNCADLATLASQAEAKITAMVASKTAQAAALAPLMSVPTDLPSVISWITAAIQTYAVPFATLAAEQLVIAQQLASLTAAVASRQVALGCS